MELEKQTKLKLCCVDLFPASHCSDLAFGRGVRVLEVFPSQVHGTVLCEPCCVNRVVLNRVVLNRVVSSRVELCSFGLFENVLCGWGRAGEDKVPPQM